MALAADTAEMLIGVIAWLGVATDVRVAESPSVPPESYSALQAGGELPFLGGRQLFDPILGF